MKRESRRARRRRRGGRVRTGGVSVAPVAYSPRKFYPWRVFCMLGLVVAVFVGWVSIDSRGNRQLAHELSSHGQEAEVSAVRVHVNYHRHYYIDEVRVTYPVRGREVTTTLTGSESETIGRYEGRVITEGWRTVPDKSVYALPLTVVYLANSPDVAMTHQDIGIQEVDYTRGEVIVCIVSSTPGVITFTFLFVRWWRRREPWSPPEPIRKVPGAELR